MVKVELNRKELLFIMNKISRYDVLTYEEQDELIDRLIEAKNKAED